MEWVNFFVVFALIIASIALLDSSKRHAEKSHHKKMVSDLFAASLCVIALVFFILMSFLATAVNAIDLRFDKLEKSVVLKSESENK